MDDRDINEAEKHFRQAVELKPDFRSGMFILLDSDHITDMKALCF